MQQNDCIDILNARNDLDLLEHYNRVYRDNDLNDDPYFGLNVNCKFYDVTSLSAAISEPIFLSINIQSLLSKHDQLVQFINELSNSHITVDAIAIQELWDIRYPELVSIPGFKPLIFKKRRNMRGGGVGFFIRENLIGQIVEELSPFVNKIFESITIKLTYPSSHRTVLLTCAYRSNGIIANVTKSQQMEQFSEIFGNLIFDLQQTNKESFIFMDSNINLLDLENHDASNYLNLLFAAGYLQGIFKATRIQNLSKTLIDHVHLNTFSPNINTGVIVSDISDHFFTFVCSKSASSQHAPCKSTASRDFSILNLEKFKRELGAANWEQTLATNEVNSAYDCFWTVYSNLFNQNFPMKRKRFNKNFNCLNNFMTVGLLTSRRTKNKLHAKAVSEPTFININRYKVYKTVYSRTIRAAKKLYIANKITENANNPKKNMADT
jgi:hypothetical protein